MGLALVLSLVAAGFTFAAPDDDGRRFVDAHFSRAVQVFPGNSVRVLGVGIGRVVEVENTDSSAKVTMRIDDPDIDLPADVEATIVPVSLLGERYIQLFPAYDGGEKFTGDEIPIERTSVPVEQDELLRSLQDYFGELDPEKVAEFVGNTSKILEGGGDDINRLIENGTSVVSTLSDKRDTLASLIENFNTVTQTLKTRQSSIAELINTYNAVAHTVNDNRESLEGTIEGLNLAALQLADLLNDHRDPLGADIRALTRTSRTLDKNVGRLAETGKYAERLFDAASKAVDYDKDWLRLNNQGEPLFELLEIRLRDRMVGLCLRLEQEECSDPSFWAQEMPGMFCLPGDCPKAGRNKSPGEQLNDALKDLPDRVGDAIGGEPAIELPKKKCGEAKHPKRCRKRKKELLDPGQTLDELLDELSDQIGEVIEPLPGSGDVLP